MSFSPAPLPGIRIPKDYSPQTYLYLHLYINSKTGIKQIGIYSKAMPAILDMSESYIPLMESHAPTFEEAKKKLLKQWNDLQAKLNQSHNLNVQWQSPRC